MINNWQKFVNELLGYDKIKYVEDFYKNRCRKDINHPDSVGWIDKHSQDSRFKIFTDFISEGDKILDYGCGVGDLFNYLKSRYSNFEYLGVDIQKYMIDNAIKKYPDAKFRIVRGIDEVNEKFNWVVASGVFTIGMDKTDVLEYFQNGINISKNGVMANFLQTHERIINTKSRYVEYNKYLLKEYIEKNLNIELICIDKYTKRNSIVFFNNRDKDFTLVLKKQL